MYNCKILRLMMFSPSFFALPNYWILPQSNNCYREPIGAHMAVFIQPCLEGGSYDYTYSGRLHSANIWIFSMWATGTCLCILWRNSYFSRNSDGLPIVPSNFGTLCDILWARGCNLPHVLISLKRYRTLDTVYTTHTKSWLFIFLFS
jgi:hypothetical protein